MAGFDLTSEQVRQNAPNNYLRPQNAGIPNANIEFALQHEVLTNCILKFTEKFRRNLRI